MGVGIDRRGRNLSEIVVVVSTAPFAPCKVGGEEEEETADHAYDDSYDDCFGFAESAVGFV